MRAVAALVIMSLCALLLVRYSKKYQLRRNSTSANVEILTSLRLSARDIFFVVHCGPDVIAFTLGPGGTCLMGRWSYEEWNKSESETSD